MKVKNSMNNNIYKKKTLKVEAFKLEKNLIFPSWFIKNRQTIWLDASLPKEENIEIICNNI